MKSKDYISLISLNGINIFVTYLAFPTMIDNPIMSIFLTLTYFGFPFISYLRELLWGRLGLKLDETILGAIKRGMKKNHCSKIDRYTFLSYVFWVGLGLLLIIISLTQSFES